MRNAYLAFYIGFIYNLSRLIYASEKYCHISICQIIRSDFP